MKAARRLRGNPTDAEKRLWEALRRKALGGARFRRQQRIGHYIVDFFCPRHSLVIEVDGRGHLKSGARDGARDTFIRRGGYTVLRFWNDEILDDLQSVLDRIGAHLQYPSVLSMHK